MKPAKTRTPAKRPQNRSPKRAASPAAARKAAPMRRRSRGQPNAPRSLRRILVPLDGSRASFAALRVALALARDLDATLVGYHALPPEPVPQFDAPPAGLPSPTEQRALLRQLAKRYFEKALRLAELSAVAFETVSESRNDVADAIAQAALRKRCDLILLGSHGRGAFRRLLMGSVATRLMAVAQVPVMVLPQRAVARRRAAG